jgi:hypothetical protein
VSSSTKVRPSHLPTSVPKKKNLSKWNQTPKGSSNFSNVRVYLFIGTLVVVVYIESCRPQPKVRPSHLPTSVSKKNLSKWNRTPKGSSNFGNVRVYLFIDTIVTIVYKVVSSLTKSMTLASTDSGSLKNFQNGTERRKARQISVVQEFIFSLVHL